MPRRLRVDVPHPAQIPLEELARSVAGSAGMELQAVHVHTHRIPMTVQVLVRRSDGGDVTLDECAALSGPLGEAIDAADLLQGAWTLEVSSPGIGEDLLSDRDFTSFRGFPVAVTHRSGSTGEAIREGLLLGRDEQVVRLNVRGRTVTLPREEVLAVRLVSPKGEG
ncbi:MAG: ribosome assembly cofactor RimP [Cyanobacteriota bacterium]|nr:ribosome assembly cofactor RimP [Cyanobacteriota bacterium]